MGWLKRLWGSLADDPLSTDEIIRRVAAKPPPPLKLHARSYVEAVPGMMALGAGHVVWCDTCGLHFKCLLRRGEWLECPKCGEGAAASAILDEYRQRCAAGRQPTPGEGGALMVEHVYRIRYSVQRGEFTKADLHGDGGCDAVLVVSIVRYPDGSVSYAFPSRDGDTGEELVPTDLFKVWSALARDLVEQPDLPAWQRAIARDTFERVRQTILLLGVPA